MERHTTHSVVPLTDVDAMRLALDLARGGVRGANPLVGAVILDGGGSVVATGHHRGAGTAHAEADALTRMGGADPGSCTMVVTLEPCNHVGRTGPCSQTILDSGIRRVVYAAADHTAAAGGAAKLAAAGVDVVGGLLAAEARELNHRWFAAAEAKRPFVTLKIAQTLDARIAAADGTSQWITGPDARADGQALRSRVDAILVGTGTILADNPRLTARNVDGLPGASQPLRVVMGERTVPEGALVRSGPGEFLHCRTRSPQEVLAAVYGLGVRHLMIEGGAGVSAAFLAAGLVDELYIYTAPTLLGSGISAVGDIGVSTLAQASRWRWDSSGGGIAVATGTDLRLHAEPLPDEPLPDEPLPEELKAGH